ncbi:thiamine pyrophosphate-binding protein [Streptomyces sp. NPDC014991]|uniref:thiamine pyrophosphate-binding protein n=1 Tax=Streptomyces sp. NPDC014991 TaxID=3364935 RepID=UPI0036FEA69F
MGSRAMQVYEAVVRGLESVGVDTAFGGNGGNIAGLTPALKPSQKIRPVMTRHEQAASFMACGYTMYTNRLETSRPWVPVRSTCSPAWRWHWRTPIRCRPSPDTSNSTGAGGAR